MARLNTEVIEILRKTAEIIEQSTFFQWNRVVNNLILDMTAAGFNGADLKHLESLSSQEIINSIPEANLPLQHHIKSDVVLYLRKWATLLENEFIDQVTLPDLGIRQTIL